MLKRGDDYKRWCDPGLNHQVHQQTLDDGTLLEVQTRLSRTGATQLFIGIYEADGACIHERVYDQRPGETTTRALLWGLGRARRLAQEARKHGAWIINQ